MAQFPFEAYLATSSDRAEKGSTADLAYRYFNGRKNLLTVVILSTINLLTLLLNASFYFPFSASIPYYTPIFGEMFDEILLTGSFFTIFGYGLAVAFILFYLICWIFAKERSGWMTAALVVFILDTLTMVGLMFMAESFADMILDILFHVVILYYIISAVINARKLKQAVKDLPPAEEVPVPELSE